jgi:uncharacterized protein
MEAGTMIVRDLIWLEEVEEKIVRKHQVYPEEVEEVFLRRPYVRFMERGHRPTEDLYAAFGQSDAGRYLAVYFILKPGPAGLIITARDMTEKEKRTYGRK